MTAAPASPAPPPPPPDTAFVWPDAGGGPPRRQSWALFRRALTLDTDPEFATLHLFAAHAYRLRVNGRVLASGPGRYVPGHEEHDTHDLVGELRRGDNEIVVEARFNRQGDFQTFPGQQPGFVAWGEVVDLEGGTTALATPGDWTGRPCRGRRDDATAFSFAIGPAEVWSDPTPGISDSASDATEAAPLRTQPGRSLPRLPRSLPRVPAGPLREPVLTGLHRVAGDELTTGYVATLPAGETPEGDQRHRIRSRYASFLHSPRPQRVELGLHWGPHWLNGVELDLPEDPLRGNRRSAPADLREGWNLLAGEPAQLRATTPTLIGWPADAGLTVRARPSFEEEALLRWLPAEPREEGNRWEDNPPANEDDLPQGNAGWIPVLPGDRPACPARHVSWDRLLPQKHTAPPEPDAPPSFPLELPAGGDTSLLLDFGAEFLGHLRLDVDAPAGTVLDVAFGEHLREDGGIALFRSNPHVDSADRFVWAGGRREVEGFFPRGGRYAQLTVRRDAAGPVTVHTIRLRDARASAGLDGSFRCSDNTLTRAWALAAATVEAGTEDTFCDAPWRERGTYLADSWVHSLSLLCCSDDHRVVRRSLRLFAQGQREDGQLPGVCPASLRDPHADFSLIYALWLRDLWARTGDLDPVEDCLPAVDRVLASPTWPVSSHSVLWDSPAELRQFVDWGARKAHRTLDENATLNAFRLGALDAAATLHEAAGRPDRVAALRREHAEVLTAWRERLWRPDAGCFAPGTADGRPVAEDSLHTQVLAVSLGLCDAERLPAVAERLARRLERNTAHAARGVPADDFAELYFLQHAFEALRRLDRFDLLATLTRECQEVMERHGAWTVWECIHRGVNGLGSLCHAWSTASLPTLTRDALGVREAEAGEPDRLLIDPRVPGLTWAEGTFPHPRGPVRVRWHLAEDGSREVFATAPDGVPLELADGRKPRPLEEGAASGTPD